MLVTRRSVAQRPERTRSRTARSARSLGLRDRWAERSLRPGGPRPAATQSPTIRILPTGRQAADGWSPAMVRRLQSGLALSDTSQQDWTEATFRPAGRTRGRRPKPRREAEDSDAPRDPAFRPLARDADAFRRRHLNRSANRLLEGTSVPTLRASLSFTSVTPGTDHAVSSTSFRSLQLCTFPLSVTLPSCV